MSSQVTLFAGEEAQALLVPASAVVDRDGQKAVFVYQDGTVHLRQVRTGLADASKVEILEGLSEGDQAVVSGLGGLTDGQAVTLLP